MIAKLMIIVVACTEASIANTQYDNKLNFYNGSARKIVNPHSYVW